VGQATSSRRERWQVAGAKNFFRFGGKKKRIRAKGNSGNPWNGQKQKNRQKSHVSSAFSFFFFFCGCGGEFGGRSCGGRGGGHLNEGQKKPGLFRAVRRRAAFWGEGTFGSWLFRRRGGAAIRDGAHVIHLQDHHVGYAGRAPTQPQKGRGGGGDRLFWFLPFGPIYLEGDGGGHGAAGGRGGTWLRLLFGKPEKPQF